MAEVIAFSDNFKETVRKGVLGAPDVRTIELVERIPGEERIFSRVYVNRAGLVTGGVFAEDAGLPDDPHFGGHMGMRVPAGTTDQRPTDGKAVIRYNTDIRAFEVNEDGAWVRPFQASNLKAVESDILPNVQSAHVFQVTVGNRTAPFMEGTMQRLVLPAKVVLAQEDTAADVLVNKNGTLWWGGAQIAAGAGGYNLPTATATVLGGVKVGANLSIDAAGVLSASAGSSYTLEPATAATLGGIRVGDGLDVDAQGIVSVTPTTIPTASSTVKGGVKVGANLTIAGDGTLSAPAPYSLTAATSASLGGVKVGSNLSIAGDGTLSAPAPYTLPNASASILGGVKVGAGLVIAGDGTLSNGITIPSAVSSDTSIALLGFDASGNLKVWHFNIATTAPTGTPDGSTFATAVTA